MGEFSARCVKQTSIGGQQGDDGYRHPTEPNCVVREAASTTKDIYQHGLVALDTLSTRFSHYYNRQLKLIDFVFTIFRIKAL